MNKYTLNPNIVLRTFLNRYYVGDVTKYRNCMFSEVSENLFSCLLDASKNDITSGKHSQKTLELLYKKQLLITKDDNSYRNIKHFQNTYGNHVDKSMHAPILVSLQPTFICNYNCYFCYNEKKWKDSFPGEIDTELFIEIVDQMANLGVPWLDIFGGEPFILGTKLLNVLSHINELPIDTAISTNGYFLDEYIINRLSGLNRKKTFFSISLHTMNEIQYGKICGTNKEFFRKILKNISFLVDKNINFALNCVILYNYTKNDILLFLEKADSMGVQQVTFMFFWKTGKGRNRNLPEKDVSEYFNLTNYVKEYVYKKLPHLRFSVEGPYSWVVEDFDLPYDPLLQSICECQVGTSRLDILPDGTSVPCVLLSDFPKYRLGNVNDSSLKELWDISKRLRERDIPSTCQTCKFVTACKGGCMAFIEKSKEREDKRCPLL